MISTHNSRPPFPFSHKSKVYRLQFPDPGTLNFH